MLEVFSPPQQRSLVISIVSSPPRAPLKVCLDYLSDLRNQVLTISAGAIANGTLFGTDVPAIVQKFASAIQPTSTPTSIPDALAKASKAWGITSASQTPGTSQNLLANVGQLLLQGFSNADIQNLKQGFVSLLCLLIQFISNISPGQRCPNKQQPSTSSLKLLHQSTNRQRQVHRFRI